MAAMRSLLTLAGFVVLLVAAVAQPRAQPGAAASDWPNHGGDSGSTKYAPLEQITAANVGTLAIAWRRPGLDPAVQAAHPDLVVPRNYRSTPLKAGELLFASNALGLAEAFDPASGRTVWAQAVEAEDLGGAGASRNLAYWTGQDDARVFNVRGRYLYALDARTGRPAGGFGLGGRVDLMVGLGSKVTSFRWSAPGPLVVRDVVVIGGQGWTDSGTQVDIPPGDIRAYDVRTGALRWTFHVVPRPGEPGIESWEQRSWRDTGNAKAWSLMSADDELGYVYVPLSSAANEWYGGQRPGDNLYSDSLVCLDAATGESKWHFQIVHHDIWDYDIPTAPVLADITVNGRRIKAVVQVTKQAFAFVFDRVTGKPVWPIEERPVPKSTVPGEWTSPTQPFPTRPAPFDRQGLTDDDLIDFTPELKAEGARDRQAVDHRPDVHAAHPRRHRTGREEGHDVPAGLGRRRQLGRRGVRSRDRHALRAVGDLPVARCAREGPGTLHLRADAEAPRSRARSRTARAADHEAALRPHHRHRPQHRRPPLDGAERRRPPRSSRP